MKSVTVAHVKLGKPPEGYRTVVFADGLRERNMLVEAGEGWGIHISIDRTQAPKRTFCLTTSPDGDEFRVTQMIPEIVPSETLSFSGEDIPDELRGLLLESDQNTIIASVKNRFKD